MPLRPVQVRGRVIILHRLMGKWQGHIQKRTWHWKDRCTTFGNYNLPHPSTLVEVEGIIQTHRMCRLSLISFMCPWVLKTALTLKSNTGRHSGVHSSSSPNVEFQGWGLLSRDSSHPGMCFFLGLFLLPPPAPRLIVLSASPLSPQLFFW